MAWMTRNPLHNGPALPGTPLPGGEPSWVWFRKSLRSFGLATISLGLVARVAPTQPAPVAGKPLVSTQPQPPLKKLLEAEAFSASPEEMLEAAATIPVYSKYNVVELLEDNRVTFDQANRTEGTYRYIFRVDREAAIPGWGVVQASWTPWLEERPTIRARVITQDGGQHYLDPSTIGEAQAEGTSLELFQDRKLLRAPLPKLQVGAVVEVEIRTREHRALSSSGGRANFMLAWNVPVHCSRLLLEFPASAPLKWSLHGCPNEVLKRGKSGARQTMRIEQGLVLPMKPREPFSDWDQEPWPTLTLSTTPSWGAVAEEYRKILETQIEGADLKSWVAEAIGKAKDQEDVINSILARLHKQVRYIGLEFGEAAIIPRTPAETLRRGYGDCKDKSTLLVALLREAGIKAHVALLRAGENRDFSEDLPGLAAFNHAIVYVEGQTPVWIDPAVSQARAGILPLQDCGRKALIIAAGTKAPVLIPNVEVAQNLQLETREVFLSEDGQGSILEALEATGASEVRLRDQFTGMDPAAFKDNLKGYGKKAYGSERIERIEAGDPLNLGTPFRVSFEIKEVNCATTSETDARVVMNPWSLVSPLNQNLQPGEEPDQDQEPAGSKAGLGLRRTNLIFPHPWGQKARWIIHVPKGYAADVLPEDRTVNFGPAVLKMTWQGRSDGSAEATYDFTCSQLKWTPGEVEAAREALRGFAEEQSPVLVFQQVGESHLQAGRLKEALAEFRKLAEAQPKLAAPLVRLARAQLEAGLGASARATLRGAATLVPASEPVHRQLGWTLEHDEVGRRFSPGWDREGAASELRKAMSLAPELRAARLDLAVLLSNDPYGEWLASGDLEEVVGLYRDQIKKGKDDRAQQNLTHCLARMGRYAEARDSAQAMEPSDERRGWTIALDACLKGSDQAVQEARRAQQDPEARRKAFHIASDKLMGLRRYPEAAVMAGEGMGISGDAAKLQARALLYKKMKRYETIAVDPKSPVGAVFALAKATLTKDLPPERLFELLSPAQRPSRMDTAAAVKAIKGFHFLSPRKSVWRDFAMDEAFSVGEYGQEGSERTGYRIQTQQSSPFPSTIFVSSHRGIHRVVSWGIHPSRLGREALWDLEHGNLEGARAWLDRAMDQIKQPTSLDPLSGHPAAQFWTKGKMGGPEDIRLCASTLILNDEAHEASEQAVDAAMATSQNPLQRAALIRCRIYSPASNTNPPERFDALSQELIEAHPGSQRAIALRVHYLKNARRLEEALSVIAAARAAQPDIKDFRSSHANLLNRAGRFEEGIEILRKLVEQGKADGHDLNNLAWAQVCAGGVTEQSAKWIEQAVQETASSDRLHTQASVLVELGRIGAAREAILKSISVDEAPGPADWYVFGRIAEALDEPREAEAFYARVLQPGEDSSDSEDPSLPTSCAMLARKRLMRMKHDLPPTQAAAR